jgi:hypothetical protein
MKKIYVVRCSTCKNIVVSKHNEHYYCTYCSKFTWTTSKFEEMGGEDNNKVDSFDVSTGMSRLALGQQVTMVKWVYPIEETIFWIGFCDKRKAELGLELKIVGSQEARRNSIWSHTPTTRIKSIRQVVQGVLRAQDEEYLRYHQENVKKYESLDEEEIHGLGHYYISKGYNAQIDAFLSNRVTERYKELNDLHQTRVSYLGVRHAYNRRLSDARDIYHSFIKSELDDNNKKPNKWRRIFESWRLSSSSPSESKRDTKKSIDSAPPTHVNERGI